MRRLNISNKASNFMIDFSLDEYKEFIEFNNTHLSKASKDLDREFLEIYEYIQKNRDNDDPGYISAIEDGIIDRAHTLRNYETIFRTSVVIQLYTFMEIHLKRFCKLYSNIHNLKNEFEELFKGKESDLKKTKKFIAKYLPISITSCSSWYFINQLSILRNQLVHSGHIIRHDNSRYNDIKNLSKTNFKLEVHQFYSEIILEDNNFLFKIIEEIRSVFRFLSDY